MVADLDRSIVFYRDVIGFPEPERHDEFETAIFRDNEAELVVYVVDEVPGPGGAYIYVDDVQAVHDRCLAAGATILAPLTDQAWGLRDFGVEDPDGHQLGVGQAI